MSARERILTRLRASATGEVRPFSDHPVPARARVEGAARVLAFMEQAERAGASIARVAMAAELPDAIARYLRDRNLAAKVKAAPQLEKLLGEPPELQITYGAADGDDQVGVTSAIAGVAETGSLVTASSAGHAALLGFLPEYHIAILPTGRIVGGLEDGFAAAEAGGGLPRATTFITGPSRTADIDQKIYIGVHGPRALHIILYDGG